MKADYAWQELYEAAILETNCEKMQSRVREAKAAIDARLHELQMDHGGTPEETQAVSDALAGLNLLRREIETRSHDTGSSKA
jgi:phage FluMu protein gp41